MTNLSNETFGLKPPEFDALPLRLAIGTMFGGLGVGGVVANVVVAKIVPTLKDLNLTTKVCMTAMCLSNLVALIPLTIYSPILSITGHDYLSGYGGFIKGLPGLANFLGASLNLTLCPIIGFIRLTCFTSRKTYRSLSRRPMVVLTVMFAWIGAIVRSLPLCSPYCQMIFIGPLRRWIWMFITDNPTIASTVGIYGFINTWLLAALTIVAYTCVLIFLRRFKLRMMSSGVSTTETNREMRVMAQFLITSGNWTLEIAFFQLMNYLRVGGKLMAFVSEILRYAIFIQDPLVYAYFIGELREILGKKIRKNKTKPLSQPTEQNYSKGR